MGPSTECAKRTEPSAVALRPEISVEQGDASHGAAARNRSSWSGRADAAGCISRGHAEVLGGAYWEWKRRSESTSMQRTSMGRAVGGVLNKGACRSTARS